MFDILRVPCIRIQLHPLQQEEEEDGEFHEYIVLFSAKDAVLEPGISKTFEQ